MLRTMKTYLAAALMLVAMAAVPGRALAMDLPQTQSQAQTAAAPVPASVQTLLALVNQERAQAGLQPVRLDPTLCQYASAKSQGMVTNQYFNHTSPTFGDPATMLARFGVRYFNFGENIAQGMSPAQIHAMWMRSPGHRANILNPSFNYVGFGLTQGSGGGLTATEIFIAR